MNILTLTSCYPVEHSPSDGIFVRSQCEALQAAGAKVTVFAPRPWTPPGFQFLSKKWRTYQKTPRFYVLNGIPVHRPRHLAPPRSDLWMPVHRQYARAAQKLITARPDVIHAHFAYPGALAGLQLARHWQVPLVLTLHGDDVNVHPQQYPRLRRALQTGVQGADLVLAVSEALAAQTARLTGRRPLVAPIGINLQVFSRTGSRERARRELGLPIATPLFLHLGRLVEEKGIRDLLAAQSALGQGACQTLFVGHGPLAGTVGATPGCAVLGVQPNERVPLFLQAADAFVLPSYSEGMPTVLVEAGALELPVIATAVGGIPELLGRDRGWLVPARDPQALAEAMRAVIREPVEAGRRAMRLKLSVLEEYDVHRNAEQLLARYESLIASRGRAGLASGRALENCACM